MAHLAAPRAPNGSHFIPHLHVSPHAKQHCIWCPQDIAPLNTIDYDEADAPYHPLLVENQYHTHLSPCPASPTSTLDQLPSCSDFTYGNNHGQGREYEIRYHLQAWCGNECSATGTTMKINRVMMMMMRGSENIGGVWRKVGAWVQWKGNMLGGVQEVKQCEQESRSKIGPLTSNEASNDSVCLGVHSTLQYGWKAP